MNKIKSQIKEYRDAIKAVDDINSDWLGQRYSGWLVFYKNKFNETYFELETNAINGPSYQFSNENRTYKKDIKDKFKKDIEYLKELI